MKLVQFLTLTGILGLLAYGISKSIFASRLNYLIQNAVVSGDQLALLVTVSNPAENNFTQKYLTGDVLVNGTKVSTVTNSNQFNLPAGQAYPMAWLVQLPAGTGNVQQVQIKGSVVVDNFNVPINLKYKFI